jgi:hypothetical protein
MDLTDTSGPAPSLVVLGALGCLESLADSVLDAVVGLLRNMRLCVVLSHALNAAAADTAPSKPRDLLMVAKRHLATIDSDFELEVPGTVQLVRQVGVGPMVGDSGGCRVAPQHCFSCSSSASCLVFKPLVR